MKKMNKKGFTLIEMLVVIAIIAVLVAIIVPTVSNSTMKAKGAADAANIRSMTAQAAIKYLEGGESGTLPEDTFKSKVYGKTLTIKYAENETTHALEANITGEGLDGSGVGLQHFVNIAEQGNNANK